MPYNYLGELGIIKSTRDCLSKKFKLQRGCGSHSALSLSCLFSILVHYDMYLISLLACFDLFQASYALVLTDMRSIIENKISENMQERHNDHDISAMLINLYEDMNEGAFSRHFQLTSQV